jgi:hypothetical protein
MADAAANGAKAGSSMRAARMSIDEAAKILNVKLPAKPEEIAEVSWMGDGHGVVIVIIRVKQMHSRQNLLNYLSACPAPSPSYASRSNVGL